MYQRYGPCCLCSRNRGGEPNDQTKADANFNWSGLRLTEVRRSAAYPSTKARLLGVVVAVAR